MLTRRWPPPRHRNSLGGARQRRSPPSANCRAPPSGGGEPARSSIRRPNKGSPAAGAFFFSRPPSAGNRCRSISRKQIDPTPFLAVATDPPDTAHRPDEPSPDGIDDRVAPGKPRDDGPDNSFVPGGPHDDGYPRQFIRAAAAWSADCRATSFRRAAKRCQFRQLLSAGAPGSFAAYWSLIPASRVGAMAWDPPNLPLFPPSPTNNFPTATPPFRPPTPPASWPPTSGLGAPPWSSAQSRPTPTIPKGGLLDALATLGTGWPPGGLLGALANLGTPSDFDAEPAEGRNPRRAGHPGTTAERGAEMATRRSAGRPVLAGVGQCRLRRPKPVFPAIAINECIDCHADRTRSETAGQLTKGTAAEPWARAIAAILAAAPSAWRDLPLARRVPVIAEGEGGSARTSGDVLGPPASSEQASPGAGIGRSGSGHCR